MGNINDEWAAALKEAYDALVAKGFTPEQAIELIIGTFNGARR